MAVVSILYCALTLYRHRARSRFANFILVCLPGIRLRTLDRRPIAAQTRLPRASWVTYTVFFEALVLSTAGGALAVDGFSEANCDRSLSGTKTIAS